MRVERLMWSACSLAFTVIIALAAYEITFLRERVQTAEAIIFDWQQNYVIWPKAGIKTKNNVR